jgi:hypothetical protein
MVGFLTFGDLDPPAMFTWLRKAGNGILVVLKLATLAQCCTIYEFNGSGFAANAFAIAHMVPIFHDTNGTFFLDNTNNHYKCSEEGGWHDFFAWEDQAYPSLPHLSACISLPPQVPTYYHSGLAIQLSHLIQSKLFPSCPEQKSLL